MVKGLVDRTGITGSDVDDVIFGQGYANGEAAAIGRIAALDAGLDISVPGLQIDRRCGSGLQSVLYACMQVATGGSDLVLAGGAESMSQAEYYLPTMRWNSRRTADPASTGSRSPRTNSGGWRYPVAGGMIETAENVGREFGISRAGAGRVGREVARAGCCRDRGGTLRRRDGAGGRFPSEREKRWSSSATSIPGRAPRWSRWPDSSPSWGPRWKVPR